jgi:chromosome segregation ATPase
MVHEINLHPKPATLFKVHKLTSLAECDEVIVKAQKLRTKALIDLEKKKREMALTIKKYDMVPEQLAKAQNDLRQVTEKLDQCKDPIVRQGYLEMQNVLQREVNALNMATAKYGPIKQLTQSRDLSYLEGEVEIVDTMIREVEERRAELMIRFKI